MKISVVIPCHNAERWIVETVRSTLDQTYPPLEVLVVDDRSTDGSISKLSDSKLSGLDEKLKILSIDGFGPARTRRHGVEQAKGEWVAFLDADDKWYPDHLERAAKQLEGTSDIGYLGSVEHFSVKENRIVSRTPFGPYPTPVSGLTHLDYFELHRKYGTMEFSTIVVKRERLLAAGVPSPDAGYVDDMYTWLSVIYEHTCSYDPKPTGLYRIGNINNLSSNAFQNAFDKLRMLKRLRDKYPYSLAQLNGCARTLMSKAILDGKPENILKARELAFPFLGLKHRFIFDVARRSPTLYRKTKEQLKR